MFPRTLANIQSDVYRGDFIAVIYRDTSDDELAERFRGVWTQDYRKQFEIEEFRLGPSIPPSQEFITMYQKENAAFWLGRIPAILLTDTGKPDARCHNVVPKLGSICHWYPHELFMI